MSFTLTRPPSPADPVRDAVATGRRTRILALPEARWAAAALGLFLSALSLQLLGAPWWAWGPLYALTYVAG
ncbi:heavy metal translocating P-type ATPase, partial [Streptomyces sp. NPDC057543]